MCQDDFNSLLLSLPIFNLSPNALFMDSLTDTIICYFHYTSSVKNQCSPILPTHKIQASFQSSQNLTILFLFQLYYTLSSNQILLLQPIHFLCHVIPCICTSAMSSPLEYTLPFSNPNPTPSPVTPQDYMCSLL